MLFMLFIIIYKTNNSINKTNNSINKTNNSINKTNNSINKTNNSINKIIHNVKEPEYTNIYKLTPYQSTTLSTNYNTSNHLLKYPSNINQKPWFKTWTNEKNQFLCYLDKHLTRRCIWTCPNKCA